MVRPHALPRMDFSSGIPQKLRTLVVVPSVLTSPEKVEDLLEGLEVRYLANRDINLYFGLLTDLLDAEQEVMPEDEHLLLMARQGIEALNEKYHDRIFFLFPRQRMWDPRRGSGGAMSASEAYSGSSTHCYEGNPGIASPRFRVTVRSCLE